MQNLFVWYNRQKYLQCYGTVSKPQQKLAVKALNCNIYVKSYLYHFNHRSIKKHISMSKTFEGHTYSCVMFHEKCISVKDNGLKVYAIINPKWYVIKAYNHISHGPLDKISRTFSQQFGQRRIKMYHYFYQNMQMSIICKMLTQKETYCEPLNILWDMIIDKIFNDMYKQYCLNTLAFSSQLKLQYSQAYCTLPAILDFVPHGKITKKIPYSTYKCGYCNTHSILSEHLSTVTIATSL